MNPERIAQLEQAAQNWIGTPFRANSRTCGPDGGVCCHFLVAELYSVIGIDLSGAPKGPPGHARFNRESIMEPWLDACPAFQRLPAGAEPEAGDLVGFRIGSAIHHLAIVLPGERIVHALDRLGVSINPLHDPTWSDRIAAVWRPVFTT